MAAVAAVAAAEMKTLVATANAGITDNNQPKLAAEEMVVEMAMATVTTTTTTARTMTAAMTTVVAAVFLPDRQQSTKIGSGRNGGDNLNSRGNGDGNSDNNNGRGQRQRQQG